MSDYVDRDETLPILRPGVAPGTVIFVGTDELPEVGSSDMPLVVAWGGQPQEPGRFGEPARIRRGDGTHDVLHHDVLTFGYRYLVRWIYGA